MKISLEILASAYLLGEKNVSELRTKELVPNMMLRRRLTRGAKLVVELCDRVGFHQGRILCGSAYGELGMSENILTAIKNEEPISPTDFQNSVYNTAVSYLSILQNNHHEIGTLSCGDKTAQALLKAGAVKALDGDELLLICFETLDIARINEVNRCIDFLESGVALKVRVSHKEATLFMEKSKTQGIPSSIGELLHVAQACESNPYHILEVIV